VSFAVVLLFCNEAVFIGSGDGEDRVANFDLAADFDAVDVFELVHDVCFGYVSIFADSANSARVIFAFLRILFYRPAAAPSEFQKL
jgi:hypothetical protein